MAEDDKNQVDSLMKDFDRLRTTETDMMFGHFVNEDKKLEDDGKDHKSQDERTRSDDHDRHRSEHHSDHHKSSHHSDHHKSSYHNDYHNSDRHRSTNDTPKPEVKKEGEFASKEEEDLAKLDMLRKLGELAQLGVPLSQNYNMKSDYKAMKFEYDLHKSIREKKTGIIWMSNLLINICWGLEMANENFNPFDFKLDGWSEQINEDSGDYNDVLGDLYEKYFKTGKGMSPEVKLMMMISGSAIKYHLSHAMIAKNNAEQELRNNPHLIKDLKNNAGAGNSNKEHEQAKQRAEDLNRLRLGELENIRQEKLQEEIYEREQTIKELQQQLAMQRSDSRSAYSRSHQPSYSGQKTMSAPVLPQSLRNQEYIRQQQIIQQKKQMEATYAPNIDNILDEKINDSQSKASIDDEKSRDNKSRESKSRGGRKKGKRATIHIAT